MKLPKYEKRNNLKNLNGNLFNFHKKSLKGYEEEYYYDGKDLHKKNSDQKKFFERLFVSFT